MTINQSFQNWTVITDEPGEELVFEHEDPETGQKDRFVLTEEAGLGSEMNSIPITPSSIDGVADYVVRTNDDLKTTIEGASAGETVVVGAGTHTVTGAIEIDVPMSVYGATANVTGKISAAPDTNIDFTDGTVIEQQTAGADVFDLTGEAQQVNLSNLILTWESSIRDSDTGHGIASNPPDDSSGPFPASGPFNCQWENITVVGNDGTSYGVRLVNPQQNQIRGLYVDGGGGIEFVQDSVETNYGNTTISGFYCKLKNDDSSADQAHGISYHAKERLLNLIYFARPQVNTSLDSVTGQKHISINEDGGTIDTIAYIGMNMEDAAGDNSSGIDFETGSYIVLPTRVGSNVPINGTLQMLTAGAMGSTDIRGDEIATDVFEAQENYSMNNPNGSNPRVVEFSSGDVQFRNTIATDNPYINIYEGGRIGLINNEGGLAFSVKGSEVEIRGSDIVGFKEYSDDTNAPTNSLYYDTTDAQLEYKDSGGTIHPLG